MIQSRRQRFDRAVHRSTAATRRIVHHVTAAAAVQTAAARAAAGRSKDVRLDLQQIEQAVQMAHVVGVHACLARVEEVEQRAKVGGLDVRKVHGRDDIDDGNLLEQVAVVVVQFNT